MDSRRREANGQGYVLVSTQPRFVLYDIVKADKPKGKGAGKHLGRVTVNSKPGNFVVNGVTCHAKYMKLIQRNDGWKYEKRKTSHKE